ncbi:MAG: arginine--tRNA ligase [Deferribacterota bacterium]|nr:arginine--tRNA ligase [Deferribacterota bacterium]
MVDYIKELIIKSLLKSYKSLDEEYANDLNFNIEIQKKDEFGDFSTNIAFIVASKLKKKPYDVAKNIVDNIDSNLVENIEVKNGFINIFLKKQFFHEFLKNVLENKTLISKKIGKGKNILIEFVSANPTGPLHIGHGRGACYGDSVARILKAVGYETIKEYYVNDRGNQIINLGKSIYYWYVKHFNTTTTNFPEDGYKGNYIKEIADNLVKEKNKSLLKLSQEEAIQICAKYGAYKILENIKEDLKNFNITFDNYFSEAELFKNGYVDKTLSILINKGFAYQKDGALWFKSSAFGDDKDRVLIKSSGEYTYFASDIAYHRNKMERNFHTLINVWGADHHGYIKRLKAAIKALGYDDTKLKIVIIQMVSILKGGKKLSMSTRESRFVPLEWLINEVSVDVARLFYCLRSPDSHLDFNIDLAKEENINNPVYYIQYAHARIHSLFKKAKENNIVFNQCGDIELLENKEEIKLMKCLYSYNSTVEQAAATLEPNKLANYLIELASLFHSYYYNYKIIDIKNICLTNARLNLCKSVAIILKNGLNLLGIKAPEVM